MDYKVQRECIYRNSTEFDKYVKTEDKYFFWGEIFRNL